MDQKAMRALLALLGCRVWWGSTQLRATWVHREQLAPLGSRVQLPKLFRWLETLDSLVLPGQVQPDRWVFVVQRE